MTARTWVVPALAATAALLLLTPAPEAGASQKIANDTALACTACHDKPGSKLLTDQGKYFELMGNLDDYEALTAEYGRCTTCHVKKPGSSRLTKAGREAKAEMGGMHEVCRAARDGAAAAEVKPSAEPAAESEEAEPPSGR